MKNKFLILILVTIFLSACSLSPRAGTQDPSSVADPAQATQPASIPNRMPAITQAAPLPATNTGENQPAQPAATQEPAVPTLAPANDSAIVSASSLNLRMGPGYGYGIIRQLSEGQRVKVLGRSVNGDWIEVMIDEQTGGWVYGRFLDASFDLATLAIKEAYGGPYSQSGQPASASTYSLYMSINGQQATINLGRFPANTQVDAFLGQPDGGADLLVASGQTNASGAAQLDFNMPDAWQDGSPINEQELQLTVRSTDGSFSQSATIQYIH
jgi:uncharacterized protein YraI